MKATLEAFLQSLQGLTREELIQKLLLMKENELDQSVILKELRKTSTEMAKEYTRILEANKKIEEENASLKKDNKKLCEQNAQLLRKVFGRQSEKTIYMDDETAPEDPLSEDTDGTEEEAETPPTTSAESSDNTDVTVPPEGNETKGSGSKGSGPKGTETKPRKKRQGMNLDGMPADHIFAVDAEKLDALYGEGNWEIINWHVRRKVKRIPELDYVEYTHAPVISIGPEGKLIALPFADALQDYSIATSSLVASILYKKFVLGIPLYRQEWELLMKDFPLSRQTMSNWVVSFSMGLFGPVYDHFWDELKKCSYIQNDETTLQVINDGRNPGRQSYMWVHMTSELCSDVNPIILFAFELTRSADHLEEYFADYVGTMISDAFGGYYSFADKHPGLIILAGCLMHARRPFALSSAVKGAAKLSKEEQKAMPEYRVLQILAMIFDLEKSYRDVTADERKALRNEQVRPLLEEFFQIVHTLDPENPEYSEKMKKGIEYALNHEPELRRFLDDGHIPCDNGACERHIRPFAVSRKVWLFCNTIAGAKATAIIYTLVETAKANKVDPYFYLKYLLDKMPGHMNDHDRSFLNDMMPWSQAFKEYVAEEKEELIKKYRLNASDKPPEWTRQRSRRVKKRAGA